eukprot:1183914-Prorocentrum_minimum.AAC.2
MDEIAHITALSQLIDDTQQSLHRCVAAVESLEEFDMLYKIGRYKLPNFRFGINRTQKGLSVVPVVEAVVEEVNEALAPVQTPIMEATDYGLSSTKSTSDNKQKSSKP